MQMTQLNSTQLNFTESTWGAGVGSRGNTISTPLRTSTSTLDSPGNPLAPVLSQKQYRGGYEVKPKALTFKPYALNNPGTPTQAAFDLSKEGPLQTIDALDPEQWSKLAVEMELLPPGRRLCIDLTDWIWKIPHLDTSPHCTKEGISLVITPFTSLGQEGELLFFWNLLKNPAAHNNREVVTTLTPPTMQRALLESRLCFTQLLKPSIRASKSGFEGFEWWKIFWYLPIQELSGLGFSHSVLDTHRKRFSVCGHAFEGAYQRRPEATRMHMPEKPSDGSWWLTTTSLISTEDTEYYWIPMHFHWPPSGICTRGIHPRVVSMVRIASNVEFDTHRRVFRIAAVQVGTYAYRPV
ncbi:hypothetical protein B0H14DRAFT_3149195 [Mycena olivaceomarginata]|nr:hypothetical protein B0H14DRAFT_3149195 [Mycena olivaceomarginata]